MNRIKSGYTYLEKYLSNKAVLLIFNPKIVTKLLEIWKKIQIISHFWSRAQKSTGSRIRIRNTEYKMVREQYLFDP